MISCVSGTVRGRLKLLQRMVQSVRRSVGQFPYEIILVACDTEPEVHEWIRAQSDCVLLIMPKAEGSVKAFNMGFKARKYDLAVTLNDDIAVEGNTIARAAQYMLEHPEVGQVAFAHKYQNRNRVNKDKPTVQRAFGYPYAQCGMTRGWIGDIARWWGDYGLVHYAGDNHLSAVCWSLGYSVVPLGGCAVVDWEHVDATRRRFSDQMRQANGGVHPDTKLFMDTWKGKLPKPDKWIPARVSRVLVKAAQGRLRTLRFKAMMDGQGTGFKPRTALIDAFSKYGPAKQANQNWAIAKWGQEGAQQWFIEVAKKFDADLVMLQGQRPNNILPATARRMRQQLPGTFVFNWDADTHYPMLDFHWKMAQACDLQLTISPDLFDWYCKNGACNIGYWPIGVEQEFIDVDRYAHLQEKESSDVIFLGSLYGEGMFPEAETRRDAVVALHKAHGISLQLHGTGWGKVGINVRRTLEDFEGNPIRYSKSKLALSISQTRDLWGYTSDRAYNILATGCPILIQRFKGMDEHGLVDGETCIAWSSFKEMLDKTRYYKSHPQEREAIGQAGKELLLRRHTWERRVEELWGLLAGLGE